MTAQAAAPVIRVVRHTRQQFATLGRLDDQLRALDGGGGELGVERHQDMQAPAVVRAGGGEDRGMTIDAKKELIQRDLGGVLRILLGQAVTLQRSPALLIQPFVFPQAGVANAGNTWAGEQDPVSMAAQPAVKRCELKPVLIGKSEAGFLEMLPGLFFEEMPARKDVTGACRMYRIAHPVKLHLARARMPYRRGAEIAARRFLVSACTSIEHRIDGDADWLGRCLGAVEIDGHGTTITS